MQAPVAEDIIINYYIYKLKVWVQNVILVIVLVLVVIIILL